MSAKDEKLTIPQVCDELQIARSTFYDWRAKSLGPKCIRLPNRTVRVRRSDLNRWLESQEAA